METLISLFRKLIVASENKRINYFFNSLTIKTGMKKKIAVKVNKDNQQY